MELATARPEQRDDQGDNDAENERPITEEPLNEKNHENPNSTYHRSMLATNLATCKEILKNAIGG